MFRAGGRESVGQLPTPKAQVDLRTLARSGQAPSSVKFSWGALQRALRCAARALLRTFTPFA